jgi:rubrerythrin
MSEIANVKEAIQTAIQMEKDGYAFYTKAASQTSSDMGKTVFESIAKDELVHLDVFEKMFSETVGEEEWNTLVNSSKKYANLNIFPKDLKEIEGESSEVSDLDALRIAMDSEKDAIDYYNKILENLTDEKVKEIIYEIIEQEKNHYKILEGEFHHINSNGYWFEFDVIGT